MRSRLKRVQQNDSSDEQGFQQSQIRVIQTPNKLYHSVNIEPLKLNEPKQPPPQKFTGTCFSIYNNINLFSYPVFLYFALEDTIVKMEKNKNKDKEETETVEIRDLGEFLKGGNFRCVYNKFDTRIDYKLDMTSFYRSFEDYLESPKKENYKEFNGKDGPNTEDIEFSSNFESGNLQFVFASENTYYLLLQNDVNTHGYNRWFYFRIRNKRKCKVKLMILNMTKPIELMKSSMGISVFSLQQKSFCRKYWTEGGSNVKFYNNGFKRKTKNKKNTHYWTLEFDYEFKFESDSVYFAMNIPFTYTKLQNTLSSLTIFRRQNIILNVKSLGSTVSNNQIYCIEYSKRYRNNPPQTLKGSGSTMDELEVSAKQMLVNSSRTMVNKKKRKSIVFLGRQHPCQTNSSYVLEGIINFLSQESEVSLFLLESYDIYIIPMINPDGVIHGLSRTNLCGYDINREWSSKNKQHSNQAYVISSYLEHLHQTTDIKYVFDLHSHSKKLGTFGRFSQDSLQLRSLAWFLEETNSNFVYSSCIFDKVKSKELNFRNYAYGIGIKNAITIQISYFGKLEHGLYRRYNTKQLHDIGVAIIKALSQLSEADVSKVIINNFVKSNIKQTPVQYVPSESQPEQDYLDERERVKIILSARRQKQSNQPKGFSKATSPIKHQLSKKISNIFNKTMSNIRPEEPKTIESPKHPHLSTPSTFYEKPFKPYSKEEILRDDSFTMESPSPKRRIQTQKSSKSPSRLYFWDQSKYNVRQLVSYPTSLHPYLERLSNGDIKSFDSSPMRRRGSTVYKHSLTTEIELEKAITESCGFKQEKPYATILVQRKKNRAQRNYNRRLYPATMRGSSSSNFHY